MDYPNRPSFKAGIGPVRKGSVFVVKKLIEIEATWNTEKNRWANADGDVLIGLATVHGGSHDGQEISIKCTEEEGNPGEYQSYRFYGHWDKYVNKYTGVETPQFITKMFVQSQPHSRSGVITYLAKAPNIGRALSTRLWDKFGANAVKVLREKPDVAAAACEMLGVEAAEQAAAWLEREKSLEGCTIDLIELLDGRGFPKNVYKQAVKLWGNQAAARIKEDPYRLMSAEIRGVGFKRCDNLYLSLGLPPGALKRQAYCAWYSIASQTSGDTWHYIEVPVRALGGSIAGASVNAGKALQLSVRGRILSAVRTNGMNGPPYWDGDQVWLADIRKARNERRLGRMIAEALCE